jgi:hypothetical protein
VSLVALSFRDSGFRTLPDWIKPFQHEFGGLINGNNGGGAMRVFQVNLEDKGWLRVRAFGSGYVYIMPSSYVDLTSLRIYLKLMAKQLLKFMMVNGQKSVIERERHGQTFLRFGNTEVCTFTCVCACGWHRLAFDSPDQLQTHTSQEIREGLGIDNRMVGYVFLVDGKGRARWR